MNGVRALGPFGLSVSDIDRSAAFYKALGFTPAYEKVAATTEGAHGLGAKGRDARVMMQTLARDGASILLLEVFPKPTLPPGPGAAVQFGLAYIELYVDDMDAAAAAIRANGGSVLWDTRKTLSETEGEVVELMFCRDPDGTTVALVNGGT